MTHMDAVWRPGDDDLPHGMRAEAEEQHRWEQEHRHQVALALRVARRRDPALDAAIREWETVSYTWCGGVYGPAARAVNHHHEGTDDDH